MNLQTLSGLLGMSSLFHGVELLGLIFASMSAAITKKNTTKNDDSFLRTLFETWIQLCLKINLKINHSVDFYLLRQYRIESPPLKTVRDLRNQGQWRPFLESPSILVSGSRSPSDAVNSTILPGLSGQRTREGNQASAGSLLGGAWKSRTMQL